MANVLLTTLRDYWKNVSDWVTGASSNKPVVRVDNFPATQNVQLTGSNVEVVTIVNAVAITDTTARAIELPKSIISKYRDFDILIDSTLDQPINIGFKQLQTGPWNVILVSGAVKEYSPFPADTNTASHQVPAGNVRPVKNLSLSQVPIVNAPALVWKGYRESAWLNYRCSTAPTAGSLTIKIVGVA